MKQADLCIASIQRLGGTTNTGDLGVYFSALSGQPADAVVAEVEHLGRQAFRVAPGQNMKTGPVVANTLGGTTSLTDAGANYVVEATLLPELMKLEKRPDAVARMLNSFKTLGWTLDNGKLDDVGKGEIAATNSKDSSRRVKLAVQSPGVFEWFSLYLAAAKSDRDAALAKARST